MSNSNSQAEKAELLRSLHHKNTPLLLPNIWEPLGAAMLEEKGFPAVATSSSALALTHGYLDGEQIPFTELLQQLKRICQTVSIPVTADIEHAFAHNDKELRENIKALIGAGIVGINYEDSEKITGGLVSIEEQVANLQLIKETAAQEGVPMFINARVDTYVHGGDLKGDAQFEETIKRAKAYEAAGADCIFPILMRDKTQITKLVQAVSIPVNIMTFSGIPDLAELKEIGVARISTGGSFLKVAMKAMMDLADQIKGLDGLKAILGTGVASDYLESLVSKPDFKLS